MKRAILFSLLSVFCLSFASCAIVNKKGDSKDKKASERHYRRHSHQDKD
jgi:hypothetical protein